MDMGSFASGSWVTLVVMMIARLLTHLLPLTSIDVSYIFQWSGLGDSLEELFYQCQACKLVH